MAKVKLGNVAKEYKETCKEDKADYPIIGLEHLIPKEVKISRWDEGKETTFTKMFRKGHMLFGRRRAYLKKAAMVSFDGICSGDIIVIEALPDKLHPELLPFIIQNEYLFDFAVGKSAGTLSPRVKWENLCNYEFNLPDIEEQKEIAKILWAMEDTKNAYKNLLFTTDELIKMYFLELFGHPIHNQFNWPVVKLSEIADYFIGLTYKPSDVSDEGTVVLRSGNIQEGILSFDDIIRVNKKINEKLFVKENDILMCSRNGSASLVGKVAKIQKLSEKMTFGTFMTVIRSDYFDYLYYYFHFKFFKFQITSEKTTTINQVTKAMLNTIEIPMPSEYSLRQFSEIIKHIGEVKTVTKDSLIKLKKMNRSFEDEILNKTK